jgi:hypothetical protein
MGKRPGLIVVKTERESAAAVVYYNGVRGSSAGCSEYYEWLLRSADFGSDRSASCSGGIRANDAILPVRFSGLLLHLSSVSAVTRRTEIFRRNSKRKNIYLEKGNISEGSENKKTLTAVGTTPSCDS